MISKIGILSDIHGNSPALRAVLDDIRRENCTRLFLLGDIINGIDPQTSIQLLQDWMKDTGIELICIKGNAESYLLTPDRDSLPSQNEEWHVGLVQLIQWYEDQLSELDLEWIRSFPFTARWGDAYFVHDSPLDRIAVQQTNTNISPKYREWYYHGDGIGPKMNGGTWQKLLEYMDDENITQVFCGHTHIPFCKEFGIKRICNVGSVGMPLDGDPRAAWVMLTDNSIGDQLVQIRRVAYDISNILQLIDQTPDYPDLKTLDNREAYKKMLLTGVHWRSYLGDGKK